MQEAFTVALERWPRDGLPSSPGAWSEYASHGTSPVTTIAVASSPTPRAHRRTGGALYVLWVVGYFVTFWATTGQTPGNRMLRIRVRAAGGERIRPRRAPRPSRGQCPLPDRRQPW